MAKKATVVYGRMDNTALIQLGVRIEPSPVKRKLWTIGY